MDQTQQTASPAYGPAGKPSVGRMVHYFHVSPNGGIVLSPATILRADVETGKCSLLVMDADMHPDEKRPHMFRVDNAPFSAEYGMPGTWSWAPVVR